MIKIESKRNVYKRIKASVSTDKSEARTDSELIEAVYPGGISPMEWAVVKKIEVKTNDADKDYFEVTIYLN